MITIKLSQTEYDIITDLVKLEINEHEKHLSRGILEDDSSEIAIANANLRMLAGLKLTLLNVEHS